MRGKKTGALLVALAVAVLLSSRGEKETGSVLSASARICCMKKRSGKAYRTRKREKFARKMFMKL